MAYDDEHADILGGPILQIPDTSILGQWSQYSILFRASLILALGLLVSLISVRAWDIWKKNQELGYRKAMRRKHGIPDSDCRPFAVAYAAATRARAEREAQDRIQANNVTEEPPAINNQVPLADAHGLRRRAAESGVCNFFVFCCLDLIVIQLRSHMLINSLPQGVPFLALI
ncbi:hypothetical protein BDR06DRAFT_926887, partial [Suillus hirtellus]